MTLNEIKNLIRTGPYAWPGGYPMYFIYSDGEAGCFECVRRDWRQTVYAHITGDKRDTLYIEGYEINYEDGDLFCGSCGNRIESAYVEDDGEPEGGVQP